MGGKTISIKLIGLLSTMAYYGLYIPAKSMTLGLNKYIKTSIGDMQSTDSGLSTFGGEIKVVSEAIERADEKGLILIDELARGTNTGQSLLDYVPYGPTIEGFGGTYATQENFTGLDKSQYQKKCCNTWSMYRNRCPYSWN